MTTNVLQQAKRLPNPTSAHARTMCNSVRPSYWKTTRIGATHCKGTAAGCGHQSCGIGVAIDGVIMWGSILSEWASLLLRWLHVVAAIAWIGSSFYFIALDLSLKPKSDLPDGVQGEAWQVHGGGFYRIVKYLVAPAKMRANAPPAGTPSPQAAAMTMIPPSRTIRSAAAMPLTAW